jgi:hypothetical protein
LELPASESGNDLFAVESAIFNKYLAGMISANDNAGDKDAGNIALMRPRIHRGLIGCWVQGDPE